MERPVAGQGAPLRSAGAPAEYPAPAARRAARSGIDRGFADGSTTMRGGRVQECDPLFSGRLDCTPVRTIVKYVFSVPAAPVAQTCSLPYRRFLTCQLPPASCVLPITNRRYGRLKICATLNRYIVNAVAHRIVD